MPAPVARDAAEPPGVPGVQGCHQPRQGHPPVRTREHQAGGSQEQGPPAAGRAAHGAGEHRRVPRVRVRRGLPHVVRNRRLPLRRLHLLLQLRRPAPHRRAARHGAVRRGAVSIEDLPVGGDLVRAVADIRLTRPRGAGGRARRAGRAARAQPPRRVRRLLRRAVLGPRGRERVPYDPQTFTSRSRMHSELKETASPNFVK